MMRRIVLIDNAARPFALLFCLACSGCVELREPQPATPQRPTLSSDASTTAPGTVEVEVGGDAAADDAFGIPATVKYGAGEATEVFGTWLVWQRREEASGWEDGIGDVLLGIRHRFLDADGGRPALALQSAVKLPVADEDRGLSSGETDVFLAGIATWSGSGFGANLYYELGMLGSPDGPGLEVGHLPALAGSVGLGAGFSLFGEAAGLFVPERDVDAGFGTIGLAWSPRAQIVFDAGLRAGIGDEAPDVLYFVGMTWNLGRPSIR